MIGRVLVLGILFLGMPTIAEPAGQGIVDLVGGLKEPLRGRTDQGIVRSIDFEKRQVVIGGYNYDFGPPGLPIQVKMLNSNTGAFELLQPGMKVEIIYGDLGTARIAARVTQLPDDEAVEH